MATSPDESNKKPPEGAASSEPPQPLPPRRVTFLARYSRNFKMIATIIILLIVVSPRFIHFATVKLMPEIKHPAHVQGEDSQAALPNGPKELAPISTTTATATNGPEIINDQDDRSIHMTRAPDTGLTEDTPEGSLPRISEDGRQPWQVYARPFNTADKRPRIAIVITDLGLSRTATDAAIHRLPANVTLAFDVQSPVVGAWCARARMDGHESLLQLPMEPFDYPRSDPGMNTLLTNLPNMDNLGRLNWALRQSTGYVGITTLTGSRFTTDPDKLGPVLDVLGKRGLMILDARIAPHSAVMDMARNKHVPAVAVTAKLDQNPSPEAIATALDQLEKTARLSGHAVGISAPLPVVLDQLQGWFKDLPQHGIALAPISAMVQ